MKHLDFKNFVTKFWTLKEVAWLVVLIGAIQHVFTERANYIYISDTMVDSGDVEECLLD